MNFKHCPNCASTNISMPESRYLECRDCQFQHYHNVAAAVAGIIVYQDEVLINIRAKAPGAGLWDLAGGFVDFNETLEQALSREVKEELGIEVTHWQYLCSGTNIYHYKAIDYHTADVIYYAELEHKPKLCLDSSEVIDARWIKFSDIEFDQFAFQSLAQAMAIFLDKNN